MNRLKDLAAKFDKTRFQSLHQEMSFNDYINLIYENPLLIRSAYQRIYDMIMSAGTFEFEKYHQKLTHYKFFDDKEFPIFGLEETLNSLVKFIRGAAGGYGTEKRVLLLHGPVGSSKSTICRRLKRGLEKYSQTEEGKLYTFKWVNLPTGAEGIYTKPEDLCPMHEDPLKLASLEMRQDILKDLNEIWFEQTENKESAYTLSCNSELCPRCKCFMEHLLNRNEGDWGAVIEKHIKVVRLVLSESERRGIATFQPKDEKNQDATELTGDIAFDKIAHFGADSDPRAFNFDGEFCVGNRGMVEFIEMLKLAQEFLYDLLGASQEKQIKPKKFPQVAIDEAIFGHTNGPEFDRLKNNQYMEALKDRTVKIDVPYTTKWSTEIQILEQDYGKGKIRQHVAPHTLEIAALWDVLTRLDDDKDGKITLIQKAKLYNGEAITGYTEETIKEMKDKYPEEGQRGISVRYTQDVISNCLADEHDHINSFMIMNAIKKGLDDHSLITKKEHLAKYTADADAAIKELDDILKDEVRKALVGDDDAMLRLCTNYIDNLMAYNKGDKIRNKITGRDGPPNERLMRSIEEKIGVQDQNVDDFRRMIAAFIGDMAHEGKTFAWDSNTELKKALEAKLFEDTKDHIRLSALTSEASVVSAEERAKIDAIKERLIKQNGYSEKSATDVLEYVGSLFQQSTDAED